MIFSKYASSLAAFLIFLIYETSAQTPLAEYTFSLKLHNAFIMEHSVNMAHLANQRPIGFEADAMVQKTGRKKWEQYHRYPLTGYSFLYMHMDPSKPLGDSYSLVAYYGKKFLESRNTFFYFRIGLGGAYIERRFNKEHNYQNNLISSRINYALNGRIGFNWQLTDTWSLNTSFGLMHYSNGAMKTPNLGINLPSVHVGLGYTPRRNTTFRKDSLGIFHGKTEFNTVLAGGLKQIYPVNGPSYLASTFSFYLNRVVARRSALNIGTDVFFDASLRPDMDTLKSKHARIKYFKWGITAGHEFLISKISLLTQFGYYLYDPFKLNKSLYQRVGLKYRLTPHLFLGMSLKTHFGQADYVEWGVGYKF